jgi:uncharacterized protein YndB with AHSA1/START domain
MELSDTLKITARGDREIVITRVFDAPRHLVFEAYTQPELLKRWLLGPPGWSMVICEVDLKVGGAYRYGWRHADGRGLVMHGVYREILPPERIVCTEIMEGCYDESVVSTVLVEKAGKTTLTTVSRYDSSGTRDTVLKSGMERGVRASCDRLEGMLASHAVQGSWQAGG